MTVYTIWETSTRLDMFTSAIVPTGHSLFPTYVALIDHDSKELLSAWKMNEKPKQVPPSERKSCQKASNKRHRHFLFLLIQLETEHYIIYLNLIR